MECYFDLDSCNYIILLAFVLGIVPKKLDF